MRHLFYVRSTHTAEKRMKSNYNINSICVQNYEYTLET